MDKTNTRIETESGVIKSQIVFALHMQELVDSIRLQNWVTIAIIIIVNNEKQAITIDEKRMDSSIIVLINDHSCDNDNVMLLIRIIELF